jgi:hypothetical protein
MIDTASVILTLDELWLLRMYVRHEMANIEQWRSYPPVSLDLNDDIAAAILFCVENNEPEAALLLSRGDCLVLDYLIPQDAKSPDGKLIGKPLLLKTFSARREIAGGPMATEDGRDIDKAEISDAMLKWEQTATPKPKRVRGKRIP